MERDTRHYADALARGTTLRGGVYRYTIERVLGQGSFGITYLATTRVRMSGALGEIDTTVRVAVKEFFMKDVSWRETSAVTSGSKGGLFADYKRKFSREAANLSRLRHPHIVKVLETFEANGTVYYAMEYCEGGSLNELAESRGGLPEGEAVGYARQIGEALSYMHAHKMLHLDVKPGNAMLRGDGSAVLIDFGLSKQYDEEGVPESSTSVGGGTPGYAPLEQAQYREGKDFPVTMDVYALGATLFKLLTGERPPEASVVLNEGFPAGALRQRKVGESVIAIVEKAMSPLRKDRYPSVEAMLAALDGGGFEDEGTDIEEEPRVVEVPRKREPSVVEKPERRKPETRKKQRGREKAPWLGAGVVLVAIAIIVGIQYNERETAAAYRLAQEQQRQDNLRQAEEARIANEQRRRDSIRQAEEARRAKEEAERQERQRQAEEARRTKEEAERWAQENDRVYQYNQGMDCYSNEDYAGAVKWWRKAAEQGNAPAQYYLGLCYNYGLGVAQDYAEAVKWWRKASEQGNADAQFLLGECYYHGRGVIQDYGEAVKCYRKAAEQGYADAQYKLGWCYHYGRGVAQDKAEAARWYRKAAEQGNFAAKGMLKEVER